MTALLLTLLAGCWKPYAELPQLDFDEVPYSNPYMESTDAVISAFDTTLPCPDDSDARFFAVYRKGLEGKAPVAIVLHSGAFDYIVEADATDALGGRHYQGTSRLQRSWAIGKVWETLGINPNVVDASENNLGTLPAALTDAGFVQLYPGNCWGDLWHNQQGFQDNEYSLDEGIERDGRTFAYWMIRMIVEPNFASGQGFSIPITMDTNQVSLVGLGDGGRGVVDLLLSDNLPAISGVVIDSSPDDLTPYLDDPDTYGGINDGLERIFTTDGVDPDAGDIYVTDWSIPRLLDDGYMPDRTAFIYSAGDPQQPSATMTTAAEALEKSKLSEVWVEDVSRAEHVFLNGDEDLAKDAVDFMQNGP